MNREFYPIKLLLLFSVYFVSARAGLMLDAVSGFATLVWIPTGISLAALLIFGFKLWPAVFLGAFLANWSVGAQWWVAFLIGCGNMLEALIGAYFLKNFFHFRHSIERVRDVTSLIIVGIGATAISASVGVLSLTLSRTIDTSRFLQTWTAWWVGDFISVLAVAPLLLVFSKTSKISLDIKSVFEGFFVFVLSIFVLAVLFFGFLGIDVLSHPMVYIVFPPLILASLRFAQKGAVAASFLITFLATIATARGLGPFADESISTSLLFLHRFMIVTSATALILGAIESERRDVGKRKDAFIGIASHELKTPITVIKNYAELLIRTFQKEKNPRALEFATRMDLQIDRLIKLVDDLLDISRIEEDKLEIKKQRFSLDEMINEVVGDFKSTSKHRIIVEGTLGKKVLADRYRLSQVLVNLLSNAAKFSPKSDKIIVKIQNSRSYFSVSVVDFGIGVSRQNKEKIFDRFFQANTKIRPSFAGLGLGLYISREIIKHHNGEMFLLSDKGRGSTFTFRVPIGGRLR